MNNGTTFTSRYAWNINADTGTGSTHDTSGNGSTTSRSPRRRPAATVSTSRPRASAT